MNKLPVLSVLSCIALSCSIHGAGILWKSEQQKRVGQYLRLVPKPAPQAQPNIVPSPPRIMPLFGFLERRRRADEYLRLPRPVPEPEHAPTCVETKSKKPEDEPLANLTREEHDKRVQDFIQLNRVIQGACCHLCLEANIKNVISKN